MHHHVNCESYLLAKDVMAIPLAVWLLPPRVFEDCPRKTWDKMFHIKCSEWKEEVGGGKNPLQNFSCKTRVGTSSINCTFLGADSKHTGCFFFNIKSNSKIDSH